MNIDCLPDFHFFLGGGELYDVQNHNIICSTVRPFWRAQQEIHLHIDYKTVLYSWGYFIIK